MGNYCSQQSPKEQSVFENSQVDKVPNPSQFSQIMKCQSSNMTIRVKDPKFESASARLSKKTRTREDIAQASRTNSQRVSRKVDDPENSLDSLRFLLAQNNSVFGSQENQCCSPNLACTNQVKQELLSMVNKEKMGVFQNQKAAKQVEIKLKEILQVGNYTEDQVEELRKQLQMYNNLMRQHQSNLQKIKKMR